MRVHARLAVLATVVGCLLGVVVGTASARRIGILNAEAGFRIIWSPLSFNAGGNTVRCNTTLEGSFSSTTFAKTFGTRIGSITRAIMNTCTGGSATVLRETLPWSVTYESFTGTLPVIRDVDVLVTGLAINMRPTGLVACLLRSDSFHPANGDFGILESSIVWFFAREIRSIPLNGFLCEFAGEGTWTGTGSASTLVDFSRSRIFLI